MEYKRFSFYIILRVVLLLGTLVLLASILATPARLFSIIILLAVLVIQIVELISFISRTYKTIHNFLNSIEYEDRLVEFRQISGKSKNLTITFNKIIKVIDKVKTERESQFAFLTELLANIPVGVISINGHSSIEHMNRTAQKILGLTSLRNISQIKNLFPDLYSFILRTTGKASGLIDLSAATQNKTLSVHISTLKILDQDIKIVSFIDIRQQIEQKEIQAWHNLIRTLGHEILNSVTPISSLTETALMLMDNDEPLTSEKQAKIKSVLSKIDNRSTRLVEFIESYRKYTRVPDPQPKNTNLNKLVGNTIGLINNELIKNNITLTFVPAVDNFSVKLDRNLIEQVLLNLIRNSIQAFGQQDSREIEIRIHKEATENLHVSIADNGAGIPQDISNKIFIPFFTTKKTGTGIGLSLSKQIMHLHQGDISVQPNPAGGTIFTLVFE